MSLTLFTGVMKSGKTKALIEEFNKLKSPDSLVIKHSIDKRFSNEYIQSRNGEKIKADLILDNNYLNVGFLSNRIKSDYIKNVFISEFNLFSEDYYYFIANNYKYINFFVEGLVYDYQNKFFGYMYKLMELENVKVKEFFTFCEACEVNTAVISCRLVDSKEKILIGDKEYQPRCLDCSV